MAESNVNPKLSTLAPQVEFVGADNRFAGLPTSALAEFIPLAEAETSADEASASVVEASASVESGQSGGVAPEMSEGQINT